MNILFTGASSCTGMHFVQELALRGHKITCVFTQSMKDYQGIRSVRIQKILPHIIPIWNTKFGDEQFNALLKNNRFETYAHHMAWTKGYGTDRYDIRQAVHNNTHQLSKVINLLVQQGCSQVILTGSVFEGMDVVCTGGKAPFEAHGMAKKETTQMFLTYSSTLPIRRFIIPNPVGTFDNMRLLEYLHTSWSKGERPHIRYPDNIRDNIPISFLRKRYADFIVESGIYTAPSGWIQSNQTFVQKVASELRARFSYEATSIFGPQADALQPIRLHNTQPMPTMHDESTFWDSLCEHYSVRFGSG